MNIPISNKMPLFDLHVHVRGTMSPHLAMCLAEKNGLVLDSSLFRGDQYNWHDFHSFLATYSAIGEVICSEEDLFIVASEYLYQCAKLGVVYVEFMLTPDHGQNGGIPLPQQVHAIRAAADEALAASGLVCRLIVTSLRHADPIDAQRIVSALEKCFDPIVVGFGLTGDEFRNDISEFVPAFKNAAELGLGLTAHVGEWREPALILEAVELLNLSRVGHGIRVVEDKGVLSQLVERQTGFEVCLSSNQQLGSVKNIHSHPVEEMLNAGSCITLSTDDPAYFSTSPANEVRLAANSCHLSGQQLFQIAENSVEMAFCGEQEKKALRDAVQNWGAVASFSEFK